MKYDLLGKAVRRFRLPVVDFTNAPVIIVPVQQGDVNSRFFEIALYDDRGDIDLSAYTRAIINGVTPSQITLTSDKCEIKEDGSAVVVNFGGGFATSPGKITCQVMFTNSEENVALTTQSFYVIVSESQFDKIVMENEENCNELLSLIEEVEGVERQIENAEEQRVVAENQRKAAELVRKENEENRINAELARNEFEQERTSKENERNAQELVRIENENKRAQNELERANAEEARADAEVARVEAEIKRENDFVAAKENVNAVVADIAQKLENGEFVGEKGETGNSAFEIAVENGFERSETEWLESLHGNDGVSISEINTGKFEIVGKNTVTPITVIKTDGSSHTFKVEARNGEGANNIEANVELLWEGEKGEEEFYRFVQEGEFSEDGVALGNNNYLRHLWKILDDVHFSKGDILNIEGYYQFFNYSGIMFAKQKIIMQFKCMWEEEASLNYLFEDVENLKDIFTEEELNKTISLYYFGIYGIQEQPILQQLDYIDYGGYGGGVWYPHSTITNSYILGGEIMCSNLKNLKDAIDKLQELNIDNEIINEFYTQYQNVDGFNFAFNRYIGKNTNINNKPEKTRVWWKYGNEDKYQNRSALINIMFGQNNSSYSSSHTYQLGLYYQFPEISTNANLPLTLTKVSVIRAGV